jgi:flavin-dependent dehydrogenase
MLAQFDICLPNDVLADPQIFSVKTMDFDNHIERFYQRFYINMNRAKFDDFLISLISKNIEICADSVCTKIEKESGIFRLEIKTKEEKRLEEAKIVIGADGANSIVRNTFYKKNKIKKYTAIQEWYEGKTISPFYSCIFDKEITDSYCWTISKDNHFIIGGAFPTAVSNEKFELLKNKVKNSGIYFEKMIKREGCFVYLNKGLAGTCTGKKGAYLIGEAAGMISPSSLEGISYSMESSKILAEIINEGRLFQNSVSFEKVSGKTVQKPSFSIKSKVDFPKTEVLENPKGIKNIGNKYYNRTLGIRLKLLLKIFKMPFMYNGFLRLLVMKSGIKAIKNK